MVVIRKLRGVYGSPILFTPCLNVCYGNVWVGGEAVVLKEVTSSPDAVMGAAGYVAGKDVLAGAVVVGNSMRVVGSGNA